ncbi:MAG: heavy metal sensor histidine kinase [Acidithiobacillus ferriphilus]|nr:heavy metal sensor histidine kinase [Acidithiobacillus ferriphilus]MBU2786022.1 heavy metal sensor histidine kinase [Acidithiobacillus ferriphilus]MBU2827536.1 heavy metal sensor histidine kinase [Acidithiobacillus ferriphilus]MBU2845751.1 heavy metal sensor histidine kinase [Acidithiobacillus ferriphilus]UEP58659.1 heavy metal sensor histidine kinase [Acidithiobacillus ferriphilus]
MFLKDATEAFRRVTGSIAVRLTLWYALLSVLLIAAAGGTLYWVLVEQLQQVDSQILSSKINAVYSALGRHAGNAEALRHETQLEASTIRGVFIWVSRPPAGIIARGRDFNPLLDSSRPFTKSPNTLQKKEWKWKIHDHDHYLVMAQRFAGNPSTTIYVAISTTQNAQFLAIYRRALVVATTLVLLAAVAAGYLIARRAMRPVARLAQIIDGLSARQLHRRVADEPWPSELRNLATNFDRLLGRLETSFNRISRFSADIAHELRTPLHILRGEAEIALSRGRSPADYQTCIESAMEEYGRLSRMVDALLFLARAEQPDAQLDTPLLDSREEVAAVCAFYQAMADESDITLVNKASGPVAANPGLLRRALGNLLGNALRHTPAGGQISIRTAIQPSLLQIIVSDSGSGIAPEDLPHVFDRFYCADAARLRQGQGTGLGLAIVRSIMQLHGGEATLQSELGTGTTVTLSFPIIAAETPSSQPR